MVIALISALLLGSVTGAIETGVICTTLILDEHGCSTCYMTVGTLFCSSSYASLRGEPGGSDTGSDVTTGTRCYTVTMVPSYICGCASGCDVT